MSKTVAMKKSSAKSKPVKKAQQKKVVKKTTVTAKKNSNKPAMKKSSKAPAKKPAMKKSTKASKPAPKKAKNQKSAKKPKSAPMKKKSNSTPSKNKKAPKSAKQPKTAAKKTSNKKTSKNTQELAPLIVGFSNIERETKIAEKNTNKDTRLPVTVLSGFLGSGKTSVLKHILSSNEHGLKIAVIVNDMAELNLDAKEVGPMIKQQNAKMVQFQNGCICCTLRGDLLESVAELSKEKKYDYLVIESTGISEPLPVAQTFVMEVLGEEHAHDHEDENEENIENNENDETKQEKEECPDGMECEDMHCDIDHAKKNPLLKYARLDTMCTVINCLDFKNNITSIEKIRDQKDAAGDEDETRTLADLLLDQIEFADVLLLNKTDLVSAEELKLIKECVERLNPICKIETSTFGKIDLSRILNTHLFDMEKAENSKGWLQELQKEETVGHTPETLEYGVSSFVFRAQRPFHPQRLREIIDGFGRLEDVFDIKSGENKKDISDKEIEQNKRLLFGNVIRSKGHLWLANADSYAFDWHSSGRIFTLGKTPEPFLKAVLEQTLDGDESLLKEEDAEEMKRLKEEAQFFYSSDNLGVKTSNAQWHKKFGDRCSELVFIGVDLDVERMVKEMQKALLTDEELAGGRESWKKIEDPFFGGACSEEYFDIPEDFGAEDEMSVEEEEDEDEKIENEPEEMKVEEAEEPEGEDLLQQWNAEL